MATVDDQRFSDEVYRSDREHVLHSWSVQSRLKPMVVNEARGIYFWDSGGKRYLDLASQLVNSNIGHQHPKVVQAIKDQADKLCYIAPSIATETRSALAKLLSTVTPPRINHFFFTNGGADANENAIKIARLATGRQKIISRYRSYHGSTYGAITLTGDPRRPPVEPGIPGVIKVYDPYCYRCTFGQEYGSCRIECAKHVEETILYENPKTVAAILIESITGSNGVFIPPREYLVMLREICDTYHILLIADEVMSGFGRTGEWFAINAFGVEPDIMTMAKGINSGYVPLGAVGISDAIATAIADQYLYCGLTYSGHPLACAAAIATIEAYQEEELIANARAMGGVTRGLMEDLKRKHPCVGDVRNQGLFGCIELVKDRASREPIVPWNGSGEVMAAVERTLLAEGVFMYLRWNYMFFAPPIIINEAQLNEAFRAIDRALTVADGYLQRAAS
jgi:taurine--2-oxoglutarate transaminase